LVRRLRAQLKDDRQQLRSSSSSPATPEPAYQESRPHLKIPPKLRGNNFSAGTLIGPGRLPVPPLVFVDGNGEELIQIQYLGKALCGHPGVVHGGLLATLIDEGLARCCFPALPNKIGVTASLKLDYRAPCLADQFVVLRAKTVKVDGRKAWVVGTLFALDAPDEWEKRHPGTGKLTEAEWESEKPLVQGQALFVQPKIAPGPLATRISQMI